MSSQHTYDFKFILAISMASALGGLLFGYDWVVIGGAKPFYERFFYITDLPMLQGWAVSSALVGCLIGAMSSGYLAEHYGRKRPLILSAILFTVSAIGTGIVDSFDAFILYRIIGGVGIGLASALSPMYIAEVSPATYRGRLVSLNQLTIVIGILLAQIVNYLVAESVPAGATDAFIRDSWNGQMGWRWMFWAETVPAVLFWLLIMLIPESPRYQYKIGNHQAATALFTRIGGADYARFAIEEIRQTVAEASNKVDWKRMLDPKLRPVIVLGIVLAVFQQWCGINVIFTYADEIFTAAGYTVSGTLFNIVITGTVNLVFTLVAMRMVDSWGRRKLLLLGSAGLAIVYTMIGASYYFQIQGVFILILVLMAIAVFAMTLAPVVWVVLAEIFPNRVRGGAMAVATTALWFACFVLTYTFPLLNEQLNPSGSFWLYAIICVLGYLYIYRKLPETKGKTLEQIELTA